MRRGGRILIVLGLVLGLITAAAAWFLLATSSSPVSGSGPAVRTVKVVVAQQNLAARAPIPQAALTAVDWPEDKVPEGAITDPAQATTNKLTKAPISIGQVIVQGMLIDKKFEETRKGIGSDASYIVPAGKVAVAFPISQLTGVAAALKEGDTVDFLVSYDLVPTTPPAGQQQSGGVTRRQVTQIALQDVEVFRVGPWNLPTTGSDSANRDTPVITFLVNPQDALVAKFLRETTAEVQLALRAAGDHQVFKTEPVIIEYIDQRFNFTGTLTGRR